MTAKRAEELTDEQWELIQPLITEPPRRADGRGRPWRDTRGVLNGRLWVMRTGAPWRDLPARFPPNQTCHRRFQQWARSGVFRKVLETLAEDLHRRGELNLSECFIDGSFIVAKRGGLGWEKTKRGKGTKLMAVGVPVAVHTTAAAPHEVTPVEPTLGKRFVAARPQRLIGDKAYDSDPLDRRLRQQGIELIAPHKINRRQPTQDGRSLRRSRRRWKIERLFAWLQNFRRLVVRHEHYLENFLGFVQLACIVILLRHQWIRVQRRASQARW